MFDRELMSRTPRHTKLLRNAESAFLAAIEIYNKPTFAYRDEAFSILMLNAWELLLKAKVLLDNSDKVSSLYIRERKRTEAGKLSKRSYVKRNRSGNPMTISIFDAQTELSSELPKDVMVNLNALVEIRDNAVHYLNATGPLAKRVYEIGTASTKNFVEIGQKWFKLRLAKEPLYLMPIAFLAVEGTVAPVSLSRAEGKLLSYLAELIRAQGANPDSQYHVAMEVKLSLKRSSRESLIETVLSDSPDALPVLLAEEDIRQKYPWDYEELTKRLRGRFPTLKFNAAFWPVLQQLQADVKYANSRLLDPKKPKGIKKTFYNPNILSAFERALGKPSS